MRRAILAMVALLLAAACGIGDIVDPGPDLGVVLTRADVVGSWRNEDFDGTITFADDGTFQATNVPFELFLTGDKTPPATFDKDKDRIDTTGRWSLTSPAAAGDPQRLIVVRTMFEAPKALGFGIGVDLVSRRQPDGVTGLEVGVANTPRFKGLYVYRKCTSGCPSASPSSSSSSRLPTPS